ncbi:T9SS type A sorting domain-containing protein [Ferruginibacter sp.]|nr:T9SS type A sorting domain-containing protein [Ferruginibacter sp.]
MKPIFLSLENLLYKITFSIVSKKQPVLTPIAIKNNLLRQCVKPLLLAVILLLSICVATQAQAPVITKNMGIPSGNANCSGVAYGNSVYIAILNGGYIYQSADGESWSKVVDAGIPAGTFTSISFGAGTFVVVGQGGLILTSANGLNWTSRTSGTTQNLTNVQFLQSAFYVTGMNTTLRRSTDGITWSSITIGAGTATDMFLYITYGSGTLVISARNTSGSGIYVYKSATGLSNSWTFQDLGFGTVNRVQYINDRFFVFLSSHEIFTSTNASTWTNITASITLSLPNATMGVWNSSNQIFNGFYDGTKYHFFGSSQYYSGYGSVFTATTGLNFSLQTKTAYIVPQGSAYLNGKYFQTGNEGIVSSPDGITYKYPTGNYMSVASSGTSYAGVGLVASNTGNIFTSADYVTWTAKTPANQQELYGVVHNGSKYLAVGFTTVVESTDDGASWNQIATPAATTYTGVAWGNSKFVAMGYDGVGAKIAYSATGATWTTASTADNYYFRIKYVNGNFFAMGSDNISYHGVIMHSTDGITWSDITPTLPYVVSYFNDVIFDGTKYHFMGAEASNYNFFSVSTATITNPNSFTNKGTITSPPGGSQLGGDWGQGAFAYSNGHFVGSVNDVADGYKTYVVYSNDGVSWTATAMNETTSIGGVIAEGNVFRLLGSGDGKITVSYSVLGVHNFEFEAALVNGQSLLQWQTADEQNTKNFVIQHSSNGHGWIDIDSVRSMGNSSSVKNYSYTHSKPEKGINYYRLIQNDIDGAFTYSKIVSVTLKSAIKPLSIYPNPVVNAPLNVQLQQTTLVSIYNSTGALVFSKQLTAGTQQLDVSGLTKGTYTIKAGETVKQIIIQ